MSNFRGPKEIKKWDIHPIWRGIGCLFFIIMPIMGYALADISVSSGWVQPYIAFSPDMYAAVRLDFLGRSIPNLKANLALTAAFTVVLYAFWTLAYALIYRLGSGAKRYGPLDSPPIERKRRGTSKSR